VKLTTHLQIVLKSRKHGSIHSLPHTPLWRSVYVYVYVCARARGDVSDISLRQCILPHTGDSVATVGQPAAQVTMRSA
jgi:hypothetical protein